MADVAADFAVYDCAGVYLFGRQRCVLWREKLEYTLSFNLVGYNGSYNYLSLAFQQDSFQLKLDVYPEND